MSAIRRIDAALARVEEVLLFAMLIGLIVLASLQVVWRNLLLSVLGSPRLWIDELLGHMTFFVGLLGASLAAHADKHIRIDLLSRLLPRGRPRLALRLVTAAATVAVCGIFLLAAIEAVKVEREMSAGIPQESLLASWQSMLAIPAAFGLLIVHFGLRLCVDAVLFARGEAPPDEEPGFVSSSELRALGRDETAG